MATSLKLIWLGEDLGLGAGLAGCWSTAETVHFTDGTKIVYDAGAVGGVAVSLAVATSAGEAEIYLMDGGRLAMAESLLTEGIAFTGTPRFNVFSGDFQLAYTPEGTFTSIREVKHPDGFPNQSQTGIVLTPPVTAGWLTAMKMSGDWLWPSQLEAASNCADEIAFSSLYAQPTATLCELPKARSLVMTVVEAGGLRRHITVRAVGIHTSPLQILGLASQN